MTPAQKSDTDELTTVPPPGLDKWHAFANRAAQIVIRSNVGGVIREIVVPAANSAVLASDVFLARGVIQERARIVAALRGLDRSEDRDPGSGPGACAALADDIEAGRL